MFAVLLVIGRHLRLSESSSLVLKGLVRGGWTGVDIFFVLSGFLVSSLLFGEYRRQGSVNIRRFLIRRGFKIYPAFWLFLTFTLVMTQCLDQQPQTSQILGELFFLQNYLGGMWNHTWSLAVEEHFYIGLAVLVTYLLAVNPRKPFRYVPAMFAVVAASCFALRLVNLIFFPQYSHSTYLYGTHIRIDSLMFGVLLSYLWHFHDLENRTVRIPSCVLILIGLALLSPAFVFQLETNKMISIAGVILFYLAGGFLLIAAVRLKTSDSVAVRVVAELGAASYSIYLWHMPVATWGYPLLSKLFGFESFCLYLFNAVIGACVFGWLLNRLIENPILQVRDRLFPSHSSAVVTGEQIHPEPAAGLTSNEKKILRPGDPGC